MWAWGWARVGEGWLGEHEIQGMVLAVHEYVSVQPCVCGKWSHRVDCLSSIYVWLCLLGGRIGGRKVRRKWRLKFQQQSGGDLPELSSHMSRNLADINGSLRPGRCFSFVEAKTNGSCCINICSIRAAVTPFRRISCSTHLKAHSRCDYVSIYCLHGDFILHQCSTALSLHIYVHIQFTVVQISLFLRKCVFRLLRDSCKDLTLSKQHR